MLFQQNEGRDKLYIYVQHSTSQYNVNFLLEKDTESLYNTCAYSITNISEFKEYN